MDNQRSITQTSLEGICEKITSRVDNPDSECYTVETYEYPMASEDFPMDMIHNALSSYVDELHEPISRGEYCDLLVKRINELKSHDMQTIQ